MPIKFSKSDRTFLKSLNISAEPTFEETRLALARRIARHYAPVQVKVDPQQAKHQLIRLSLEKVLDASEDRGQPEGHIVRAQCESHKQREEL